MMGFSGFGMLFMLLFWVAVVALVIWGMSAFSPRFQTDRGTSSPRDLLDTRYARGEITREQYEEMRQDLR